MHSVLLVEDDKVISNHIRDLLVKESCHITQIDTMALFLEFVNKKSQYDGIILDRLIGTLDTKQFLKQIKSNNPQSSLLIVSAINTPAERAELINLGADDYIGKPFVDQELLARLRSLLRRGTTQRPQYRQLKSAVLDLDKRLLLCGDKSEMLPGKEFLLLKVLSDDIGKVYDKNFLLETVWGLDSAVESNVLEVTIGNLRKKILSLGGNFEIKNMRNSGYWIEI
ncbi:response regulator transcription factor [bacterium]|nr:response regulator transcription factor [bacterium]